jgi:hypothetical protein
LIQVMDAFFRVGVVLIGSVDDADITVTCLC